MTKTFLGGAIGLDDGGFYDAEKRRLDAAMRAEFIAGFEKSNEMLRHIDMNNLMRQTVEALGLPEDVLRAINRAKGRADR